MSNVEICLNLISVCNMHPSIYAAFGLTLALRALTCHGGPEPVEKRELLMHGLVYLSLALFR
jgi:hypothetical protein